MLRTESRAMTMQDTPPGWRTSFMPEIRTEPSVKTAGSPSAEQPAASDAVSAVSAKAAAAPSAGHVVRDAGLLSNRRTRAIAYGGWLALTFVVGLLTYAISWEGEVERHQGRLATNAAMGAKAIDTYLRTLEKALIVLGDEMRYYDDWTNAHDRLAAFKRAFPEFQIVTLTLPDGSSPANSEAKVVGEPPNVGAQAAFKDAVERLRKGASMVVERPFIGPVSKIRLTKLRVGVRDAAGNLMFTVAGGLPVEKAFSFWRGTRLPPDTAMGVMRDDYYLLVRHPQPPGDSPYFRDEPFVGPLSAYLKANAQPAKAIFKGRPVATGLDSMIAFERLESYPLYFFVSDPTRNLWTQWRASSWPFLTLIFGLMLGGLFLIRRIGKQQAQWAAEREGRVRELEALNDRLRATNAEIAAANAELNAFSYTVSHDLRAPIRAIDGFTAVLAEELGDSPSPMARDMLARVRANASRMGDLINDLLELSRLSRQEMQLQTVDMQAEVASILEELASLRGNAMVQVDELPPAHADRVLMRQVWSNLIVNAFKYSARTASPVVHIGYEGGRYFVEDNGAGFDMAYVGKLFQMFSRLHSDREFAGTGVGLAIVRRIVERHGGGVTARGELGRGAHFSFSLPD